MKGTKETGMTQPPKDKTKRSRSAFNSKGTDSFDSRRGSRKYQYDDELEPRGCLTPMCRSISRRSATHYENSNKLISKMKKGDTRKLDCFHDVFSHSFKSEITSVNFAQR